MTPPARRCGTRCVAAADAALTSCGTAPETAAAGVLLRHAVRLSALAGAFDEAYAGLEQFPFKFSQAAYGDTLTALGKYLAGQGMVEEGRRYRDRLLTRRLLRVPTRGQHRSLPRRSLRTRNVVRRGSRALVAVAVASFAQDRNPAHQFPAARDLRAMSQDEKTFSEPERALLSRAAWTRLYARGRNPEKTFTDELYALNPEIKADRRQDYAATIPMPSPIGSVC